MADGAVLTPDEITSLFSRDGAFLFAKWGKPVAPVVFGLADETLKLFRDVLTAILHDIKLPLVETDPETGANFWVFFVRTWDELDAVPDIAALTGQDDLSQKLKDHHADQYRIFRFDADGGIRACFTFVNMGGDLADAHPAALAEALSVRALLTFATEVTPSKTIATLLRAAYDPAIPVASTDPSLALRLAARMATA